MQFLRNIFGNRLWSILIITITILLLYGKTIQYEYALDDYLIKTDLPKKEAGIRGLYSVFEQRFNKSDYRPILLLSFTLENYFFGENNPEISHIVNVLLYIFLCIAIYFLILALPLGENKSTYAFIITLLFAVHPIHSNVVCNLKSRDNILSMLFGILSTITFVNAYKNKINFKTICQYLLATLFFIIGVLSKIDIMGFVLIIPLILILFYVKNYKKLYQPILLVIILFIVQSTFYTTLPDQISPIVNEETVAKVTYTENPIATEFTLPNRIGAAAITGFEYLKLMLIPYGYWYYFGYNQIALYPITNSYAIISLLILISLILLAIYFYKKEKLVTLGILSFFILSAYCFNYFLPVAGIIADRYAFMSSLGFCIALFALLNYFTKNTRIIFIVSSCITLIWSIASFNRASAWKNGITLIENDAPHLEKSYEGQRIAAMTYVEYFERNNDKLLLDKALVHIKKANSIYSKNHVCKIFEGIIYYKMGNIPAALQQYQNTLQNDTDSSETLELIGDLKYELGKQTDALYYYNLMLQTDSSANIAVNKISTIIYETQSQDSVFSYNQNIIKTHSNLFAPYENLSYLYLIKKDTATARKYFYNAINKGMPLVEIPTYFK